VSSFDSWLETQLSSEKRESLLQASRKERLNLLAEWLEVSEDDMEKLSEDIAEKTNLPFIQQPEFDQEALPLLPVRVIHEFQCLPLKLDKPLSSDSFLPLATTWPPDRAMNDWIWAVTGKKPQWFFIVPAVLNRFITETFGVGSESLDESFHEGAQQEAEIVEEDSDAAIIRFVNEVIRQAVQAGATDIHVEPMSDDLRIRYRVDGGLVPIPVPETLRRYQDAVISRLKIMAKLNISEKRRPQDGRIPYRDDNSEIDIRLSTVPTMHGESVSLRLLNKKSKAVTFQDLGMPQDDMKVIEEVLGFPHGIVLVTGPTGSGKSTSLNAFIRKINRSDKRVITIEDPVEYEVPGANQIQVMPEIQFGFAQALRHVLRQDPDIIMVGEIRDFDTAEIAIRASLTGHLVFSTLHTNDAPGALTRLSDMGIEPFLIASAVELVIAQRLVRRLCRECAQPVSIPGEEIEHTLKRLKIPLDEAKGELNLRRANGCSRCRQTGYQGRIGIFETLRVGEFLHDAVVNRESSREIRRIAIQHGMKSLAHSGWGLVKQGVTSLEDLFRVVELDAEEEETMISPHA